MYFIVKKTQLSKMREVTIDNNSVARNIVSSLPWAQQIDRIENLVAYYFMGVVKKKKIASQKKTNQLKWNGILPERQAKM